MMNVAIKPLFVDLPTASKVVALSESTIQSKVASGEFPAPRKISDRRVGWLMRELESWAEGRPVSNLLPPENTGAKKPRTDPQAKAESRLTTGKNKAQT